MFRTYTLILMLSLLTMPAFADNSSGSKKIILQFNTMVGVDTPFLSTPPPDNCVGAACDPLPTDPRLRNIPGDYESWKVKTVNGKLFTDGTLIINIKGLIFGDGSPNDEDHFRAFVSCQLTPDLPPSPQHPTGVPATFTDPIQDPGLLTAPFPTGGKKNDPKSIAKGNANIKAKVNLPSPCIAPAVFILNGDGAVWFAVTGN
ncbi:MAG: hypothetical protein ACR65R_08195 [Methylomicrobium sp.]